MPYTFDAAGDTLTLRFAPPRLVPIVAIVLTGLSLMMPVVLLGSAVGTPTRARIECTRETCQLTRDDWRRVVPVADIMGAAVLHDTGNRRQSSWDYLAVTTKSNEHIHVTDAIYAADKLAALRDTAQAFDRFITDPSRAVFNAEFDATDVDWPYLIFLAVILPLFAWSVLSIWGVRTLAIDRKARTATITQTRKLRAPAVTTHTFKTLRIDSRNLVTDSGEILARGVPADFRLDAGPRPSAATR